jgi:hypothetical protein
MRRRKKKPWLVVFDEPQYTGPVKYPFANILVARNDPIN